MNVSEEVNNPDTDVKTLSEVSRETSLVGKYPVTIMHGVKLYTFDVQ